MPFATATLRTLRSCVFDASHPNWLVWQVQDEVAACPSTPTATLQQRLMRPVDGGCS